MITLGSNLASLKAQRQLGRATQGLMQAYERLSSGLRFNHASDDAAGLAISDPLNSDIRLYTQAIRNLNDGISLLNIADSSVNELSNIVTRIKELAEEAANGTLTGKQRSMLDAEAQALSQEYLRIAKTTTFNGLALFDGTAPDVTLQAGYGPNSSLTANYNGLMGDGTVTALGAYTTESTKSHGIALADLNGDGVLDMVPTGRNSTPDGYTTVRLGLGNGSFGAAVSYAAESMSGDDLALGDLNGDGAIDIVTAGRADGNDGYATIRLGRGDGTFGAAVSYISEPFITAAVSLGDLNGDSILDIVTSGQDDGSAGCSTVRLGRGDGSFGAAVSYSTGSTLQLNKNALGDLNNDSILDLAVVGHNATDGYAVVYLGRGDGSFGGPTSYLAESNISYKVALFDVDDNGTLDMITAGKSDSADGYATVRLGLGDGTFGQTTSYTTESMTSGGLILSDMNGDGIVDLITCGTADSGDGYATIRLGTGGGIFGAAASYIVESAASNAITVGDVNGDGVLDLATAGYGDGVVGYATISLGDTRAGVGPLLPFCLKSQTEAKQALTLMTKKLDQLALQRGSIGASQSRIGTAINVIQSTAENYAAADSRIRDADVAEEAVNLIRLQVLQQAASAVLAQVNQQPALALRLLGVS